MSGVPGTASARVVLRPVGVAPAAGSDATAEVGAVFVVLEGALVADEVGAALAEESFAEVAEALAPPTVPLAPAVPLEFAELPAPAAPPPVCAHIPVRPKLPQRLAARIKIFVFMARNERVVGGLSRAGGSVAGFLARFLIRQTEGAVRGSWTGAFPVLRLVPLFAAIAVTA